MLLTILGSISALAMALVLAFSAAQKAVVGQTVRPVLQELGFPRSVSKTLSYLLVLLEVATVVSLVALPRWLPTYMLVLMLAGSFSIAGLLALTSKRDIRCGCFGISSRSKLGWKQVLALPLWVLAGWFGYTSAWQLEPEVSLAMLSAIILIVGIARCARIERLRRQLRWDRFATAA